MFHPAVFGLSCVFGFLVTFGIGANDLANSFGTAYGSKVLTLPQLVVIASICELGGAILMGGQVAKTIAKGIADDSAFHSRPEQFMYGMLCALIATALWLFLATWRKLPVSTTHSIIGGVMGFALVYGGFRNGVHWAKKKDTFPFVSGVTPVFVSWVASPALAMGVAALIFAILRVTVLRRQLDCRSVVFFGLVSYLTMFANAFFIITKGFKNRVKWPKSQAAWVSVLIALPFGVAGVLVVAWLVRKERQRLADVARTADAKAEDANAADAKAEDANAADAKGADANAADAKAADANAAGGNAVEMRSAGAAAEGAAGQGPVLADPDQKQELTEPFPAEAGDERHVVVLDAEGKPFVVEQFDPAVENVFRFLQIATSIIVSFAHGANDVSNGVGAVAASYHLAVNDGQFPEKGKAEVPLWMLAAGGVGIVIGLALWGRNVLKVVGHDLVKLTASRGFVSQFAAAVTVTFASVIGIPVSTTHCITGGVLGIGVVDDFRHGVKWAFVLKIALGWIATVIFTAGTSAIIYLPFFFEG